MNFEIKGETLPVLILNLEPDETVVTEAGAMSWMSTNLKMDTNMKGGLLGGLGRAMSGESVFLNTYTSQGGPGLLACSSSFPGQILAFDLQPGEVIMAQKGAFLAGASSVTLSIAMRKKLGVGFFGGEGFILQKIEGPGKVFLEVDGHCVKYSLGAGESLTIDPGHLAAQTSGVNTDVKMVKGFKNVMLGGEGLLVGTLTGPGDVWLQTMPISNVAKALAKYFPNNN